MLLRIKDAVVHYHKVAALKEEKNEAGRKVLIEFLEALIEEERVPESKEQGEFAGQI